MFDAKDSQGQRSLLVNPDVFPCSLTSVRGQFTRDVTGGQLEIHSIQSRFTIIALTLPDLKDRLENYDQLFAYR
jgi:hypothetical protein